MQSNDKGSSVGMQHMNKVAVYVRLLCVMLPLLLPLTPCCRELGDATKLLNLPQEQAEFIKQVMHRMPDALCKDVFNFSCLHAAHLLWSNGSCLALCIDHCDGCAP